MDEEKKPFNDVIEHFNKIEGNAAMGDLKKLPKPLKYLVYFIIIFISIAILLAII